MDTVNQSPDDSFAGLAKICHDGGITSAEVLALAGLLPETAEELAMALAIIEQSQPEAL